MKEILIDVRNHTPEERKAILNALKNGGAEVRYDYWCGFAIINLGGDNIEVK